MAILLPAISHAFQLKNGDLLFCTGRGSDFSEAITEATASDTLSFIHVAIVRINENGEISVVEASPSHGVWTTSLNEFLQSASPGEQGVRIIAKRLPEGFPANSAVEKALGFVGQPYDWYFLPENGMMYCSELIYEAYIDDEGNHFFGTEPMNFRSSDGTMPQFWIDLYNNLGVSVPEGIPGTNPNQLAHDWRLILVGEISRDKQP